MLDRTQAVAPSMLVAQKQAGLALQPPGLVPAQRSAPGVQVPWTGDAVVVVVEVVVGAAVVVVDAVIGAAPVVVVVVEPTSVLGLHSPGGRLRGLPLRRRSRRSRSCRRPGCSR